MELATIYNFLICVLAFSSHVCARDPTVLNGTAGPLTADSSHVAVWGDWDYCPKKTYAVGFQLLYAYPRNKSSTDILNSRINDVKFDWTFVNGVRLICAPFGTNDFYKKKPTSLLGPDGDWNAENYCDYGVIVGFKRVGGTYIRNRCQGIACYDYYYTLNVNMLCAGHKFHWLEGDGLYEPTGSSRNGIERKCRTKQAVTAIRTQVDIRKPDSAYDNHGMTDMELICEDIYLPSESCKTKTFYDLIVECNNGGGQSELICKYSAEEGFSESKTKSIAAKREMETSLSVGFNAEASAYFVSTQISHDTTWKMQSGIENSMLNSQFWSKTFKSELVQAVPKGHITRVYQVTATCGDFTVRAMEFVISERGDIPLPNPIPATGFVCDKPPETYKRLLNLTVTDEL